MSKFIFITGGVVSSLGKGIAAASIGKLLEARGLRTTIIKCDPYLNVDPGTMNPYQHGEVYVTEDGAETDLDLGHYERFTNAYVSKDSNITTGKIYYSVIMKERRGDYLGKTVQIIPHITDEIKDSIRKVSHDRDVDVTIVEIGGTVGDIESLPFLEAIRQMRWELGESYALNIHVTLLPYIRSAGEHKTKPTQHSVGRLREIGIMPDILLCRTEKAMDQEQREKIALFCNVDKEAVIDACDVKHIYEVPMVFKKEGLDDLILKKLHIKSQDNDLRDWQDVVIKRLKYPEREVKISVVGKYISLPDAYKSIYEALVHGGIANNARVFINKIDSEDLERDKDLARSLNGSKGILIPGGFGTRGIEGKIRAVQYAREKNIPFFGICLGMQVASIEFARNVCGLKGANSTEFDQDTKYPVISLLEEQKNVKNMGASMRLGAYACHLLKNSLSFRSYKKENVLERHRHRYEFNNKYKKFFEQNGMLFAGMNTENHLVEIIELKGHPWFVACQFHPEFKSKPERAHPLFRQFIAAALENSH
ncbi:MAG: CTP synthase [Omnitrophica WOR_2 bacterium RIFCSPHIGHO2_01_FULL_48_9]|nr:MAG: CTP synthase [Omnitrophica WOR_2 bacterium RIFCSPHIGHO2_02_FULL_48_11]OGX30900.1 MAG: CTP synthase [Omnitrophica WOR_2 bacterium RIFCSPHIGHO2_01_FULL_48_9]